jgi:hypothetical protein
MIAGPEGGPSLLLFIFHLWLAPSALIYEAAKSLSAGRAPTPPPPTKPINWLVWRQRQRYEVQEFAAILARNDPVSALLPNEQASFQKLILEQLKTNKLSYIEGYGENYSGRYELGIDEFTEIEKDVAIKWAEARGFDVSHVK